MLEKFLQTMGLSDKEAQVYLSMLSIGTNPASVIARHSGLSRTTVYSLLETLVKKQFVTQFEKKNVAYFSPERPEKMITLLDKDLRQLNSQRKECKNLMPEFRALIGEHGNMPKVRYFEGVEGIKAIYEDHLHSGQEKLAYSSAPSIADPRLREWIDGYIKKRIEAKISVRAIFQDTEAGQARAKEDAKKLTQSRLVPKDLFPFKSEISLYGSKMAMMSFGEHYHGVIIESADIVDTQRSIFELAWRGAA